MVLFLRAGTNIHIVAYISMIQIRCFVIFFMFYKSVLFVNKLSFSVENHIDKKSSFPGTARKYETLIKTKS